MFLPSGKNCRVTSSAESSRWAGLALGSWVAGAWIFYQRIALSLDRVHGIRRSALGKRRFDVVCAGFSNWLRSQRASVCATCGDCACKLVLARQKEIHVGRLDLGLLRLLQVRVAARLDAFQVIGRVGVAHHPVGAHFIGVLGHYRVAIESDAMFFLLEQRGLASYSGWLFTPRGFHSAPFRSTREGLSRWGGGLGKRFGVSPAPLFARALSGARTALSSGVSSRWRLARATLFRLFFASLQACRLSGLIVTSTSFSRFARSRRSLSMNIHSVAARAYCGLRTQLPLCHRRCSSSGRSADSWSSA